MLERLSAAISGERLFRDLERYVAFGHRHYGAARRGEAIQMMMDDLEPYSETVERQTFTALEPLSGVSYQLTNIIARTAPEASRRLLLGTHWDTRLWAEEEADPALRARPIPGANDGTSGVVVLLELLRVLGEADVLDGLAVDVVLFDGEELGRPGSPDVYSQGAKRFAGDLRSFYPERPPIGAVIVDMVGDRELTLRPESYSTQGAPAFAGLIWDLGRARFPRVFLDRPTGPIFDDHVPLQRSGIPAVLLIDLDYEPWHTLRDTPERCSAESLALVTRHLAELLLVIDGSPDIEKDWGSL